MSDSESISDYPSDLELEIEIILVEPTQPLDSGIESNDGYSTDPNENIRQVNTNRRQRLSRNRRINIRRHRR